MALLLLADLKHFFFGSLLFVLALFLILLVLVQRGRGGGLTGALGGMGGQSAFGSKAGDVFTRITIGVAAVWLILCVGAVAFLGKSSEKFAGQGGSGKAKSKATSSGSGASDATDPGQSSDRSGTADENGGPAAPAGSGSTPAVDAPATDAPGTSEPNAANPAPPAEGSGAAATPESNSPDPNSPTGDAPKP